MTTRVTRLTLNVCLAAILLLLAVVWRESGIRQAVKDAKLRERQAVLDSLSSVTDTLFADSLKRLQTRISSAEADAGRAKREVGRLRRKFDSLPPPAPTDTVRLTEDSLVAYQDSVIFEQDQQLIFWRAVADAKDSTNLRLRQERDHYRALAEDLNSLAHPGLLSRVSRGVPYLLAGAILWEAVR